MFGKLKKLRKCLEIELPNITVMQAEIMAARESQHQTTKEMYQDEILSLLHKINKNLEKIAQMECMPGKMYVDDKKN